jgi:hypothetical protein
VSQFIWPPSGGGATQSQIEAAIGDALAAFFPIDPIGQIYHAAADDNIGTVFSEAGGTGDGTIPAGTKQIQVSSTVGKPLQLGIGANAGAAVAKWNLVAGGGPVTFPIQFTAADILCVRTLDGSTVSTGAFVVNFLG